MTFTPIINHDDAEVGIFRYDVADEFGEWVGRVSVFLGVPLFKGAQNYLIPAQMLVEIAKFMREKETARAK